MQVDQLDASSIKWEENGRQHDNLRYFNMDGNVFSCGISLGEVILG